MQDVFLAIGVIGRISLAACVAIIAGAVASGNATALNAHAAAACLVLSAIVTFCDAIRRLWGQL